ncbi:MAG: hypothetical protein PHU34_04825 [Candidatus Methanoperedens sp.]|nr:hypothetical protein [Candidatus Methanoperedens sp.]
MSLWNWIKSGIFRSKTKLDGESHQKQTGLSDDTKQDNKLTYKKEKLYWPHNLRSELAEINNRYQEAKDKLEKEREITSNFEREIEDVRRRNNDYRKEIEANEESIQNLKSELAEINNRYQETIEKLDKIDDKVVTLEMLILDLDKELGLFALLEENQETELLEAPIKYR